MATLVQILGAEGSGKSNSIKHLPPEQTLYINADKKPLGFPKWKSMYNKENKNYLFSSDFKEVSAALRGVSQHRPDIKYAVIDTINSMMSDKEMAERKKTGYDKWMDLAGDVYDLYCLINNDLREDMIIFVLGHVEPYEVDYMVRWRLKTNGQKLTKLNVEGKSNFTLYTEVKRVGDNVEYNFTTQSDGSNTARSPEGCFNSYRIPNNLMLVAESIKLFE